MWNSHEKKKGQFGTLGTLELFRTLVLVLHCCCGDNVKYGLLSQTLA